MIYGSAQGAYGALGSGEVALYCTTSTTLMVDNVSWVLKFTAGGNTERARITSGGDFLVGTTTATAKLTVSTGNAQCFQLNNNSAGTGLGICTAESTSFATGQVALNVARAANSAYAFLECWSGGFGDVEFKLRGDDYVS